MKEELKFPLRFKCPRCNHDKRLLEEMAKKERAEGIITPDAPVCSAHHNILLADDVDIANYRAGKNDKLKGKKLRRIFYYADICLKCGTQYTYLVELKEMTLPPPDMVEQPMNRAQRRHGPIFLPGGMNLPPDFGKRN